MLIMVDYKNAVEIAAISPPLKIQLYNETVAGIQVALSNHRAVYVQTVGGVYINYGDAVDDGKTYLEAVASTTYNLSVLPAEPDYEMYLNGSMVTLRAPLPTAYPDWMEVTTVWSSLAECWYVNVIIEEPFTYQSVTYDLDDIEAVTVGGITAIPSVQSGSIIIFRVGIGSSETQAPAVNIGNVKVMANGSYLW